MGTAPTRDNLLAERLQTGDMLLLIGPWKEIERYRADTKDLAISECLSRSINGSRPPARPLQALVCLLLVIGLMVSGVVPNVQAALIGCLLMGALGCVDFASAYRSIDWKTIVLIVGMLPFSIALERTGGVDLAAEGLRGSPKRRNRRRPHDAIRHHGRSRNVHFQHGDCRADGSRRLAVADEMGVSPYPFAMIVALAASTAFMTPVSSR